MSRFTRKGLMTSLEASATTSIRSKDDFRRIRSNVADGLYRLTEGAHVQYKKVTAIESLIVTIEEALDETQDLERIAGTIQTVASDSENEEGLTEQEVVLAEESLRVIYRRLGLPDSEITPTLEELRTKASTPHTTRLASEGVFDAVQKLWHRVVGSVGGVNRKFIVFLDECSDKVKEARQTLEGVKELVVLNKIHETITKEKTFDDEVLHRHFPTTKAVDAAIVKKTLAAHTEQSNLAANALIVVKAAEDAVKLNGSVELNQIKKIVENVLVSCIKAVTGESARVALDGDSYVVESKHQLVEGKHFTLTYNASVGVPDGAYTYRTHVELSEPSSTATSNKKVAIAKLDELLALCKEVDTLLKRTENMIAQYRKDNATIKADASHLLSNKTFSVSDTEAAVDSSKVVHMLAELVTLTNTSMVEYATKILHENLTVIKAAMTYIDKCRDRYFIDDEKWALMVGNQA